MPRHSPERPTYFRKPSSIKMHVDHSQSETCDCFKCGSFMFLVTVRYEGSDTLVDELECFQCKKIKRLGAHDPLRKIKKNGNNRSTKPQSSNHRR